MGLREQVSSEPVNTQGAPAPSDSGASSTQAAPPSVPTPAAPSSTPAAPAASTSPAQAAPEKGLLSEVRESSPGKADPNGVDHPAKPNPTPSDQSQEAQKTDDGKDAKGQAPEKYELKLPEGVEIKPDNLKKIESEFKELGLDQKAAQKLIDLQSGLALEAQKVAKDAYDQTVKGWKDQTIQTLGADYKQELLKAERALDQFGSPELKKLLSDSGFENHPKVIDFLLKVEKQIAEDTMIEGRSGNFEEKSAADVLYPDH